MKTPFKMKGSTLYGKSPLKVVPVVAAAAGIQQMRDSIPAGSVSALSSGNWLSMTSTTAATPACCDASGLRSPEK